MVGTTIAADQAIMTDCRRWNLILTDQNGNRIESANGDVISLSHTIETSSGTLTIGDIITQNINIELRRSIDIDGTQFDYDKNASIDITYGLRNAPGLIHMGRFRVNTVSKEMDRIKVNLKDFFFVDLNERYQFNPDMLFPAPVIDVIRDILGSYMPVYLYAPLKILKDNTMDEYIKSTDKAGTTLYVRDDYPHDEQGNIIVIRNGETIAGKKRSEALRICAGLLGCMLVKGRDNAAVCVRPSRVPYTVNPDRAAEPQFSGDSVTIKRIECDIDDDTKLYSPLREPNKPYYMMTFDCPLSEDVTQSRLDEIANEYKDLSFRPAMIDHKLGDPRLDPLDIITYQSTYEKNNHGRLINYTMPLMYINYNFDGGLSCNLQSTAKFKEVT